ncbi:RNA-binding protein 26 isoform X2 [Hydra vulgaris]|uniref:RNA-binding protein 26 isoform X2 n=1 Tax=Hydra vulgaris TaxID=6087 RepID=A0ABM4BBT5_HYDVU
MIIEGLDALKLWLSKKLEPICDADPAALAKYVIALIKKDKVQVELKALCEDQLDVFLGDNTKKFVADLFSSLDTKSYLPVNPDIVTNDNRVANENSIIVKTIVNNEQKGSKRKSIDENDKNEIEKVQKTENKSDVGKTEMIVNNSSREILEVKQVSNDSKFPNDSKLDPNEANTDKNKKTFKESIVLKPRNGTVNEKDLSKEVSLDKSLKSASPGQARRRHSSRHGLSPNRISRHSKSSRRDRSRREHENKSRERRPRRKEKDKCRDYEEKGFCMLGEVCPYDHGHDPLEVDDTNLPQMLTLAGLPSIQPHQNFTQQPQPPQHLQFLPNMLPSHPMRPLQSAVPGALSLNTGLTTVHIQKQTPIPSPIEINRNQVPIFRPRNSLAFIKNNSPVLMSGSKQHLVNAGEAYNPEAPAIEATESCIMKSDGSFSSKLERAESDNKTHNELIQIALGNVPLTPIVGTQPSNIFQLNSQLNTMQPQNQTFQMYQNVPGSDILQQTYLPISLPNQQQHQQQQQAFHIQMQLQQQQATTILAHQQQQQQQAAVQIPLRQPFHNKTVLEIRKIPSNLNNIVKISEHFQKFGVITKIQTPFDNDQQAALVEFATYQQANSAYNSPEAILGNRFIKMFWHNPNRQQKNNNQQAVKNTSSQEVAVEQKTQKPKKVASSNELVYRNPKTDPNFINQEKKKELEKLKMDLAKKKQFHYEELLEKQKGILKKLQDGKSLTKEQRERLLKTFKHCDVTVQRLKKEILDDSQMKQKSSVQYSKDPNKEILDREIDIYNGHLGGDELEEAKHALILLKKQIGFNPRGRGFPKTRGRGASLWHRGRGRGGFKNNILDNRPKQLLVTGFAADEKESVISHFAAFSQMDRIEETTPDKLILTFPTRQSAETAATRGMKFNGKQLILSWFYSQPKTSISNDIESERHSLSHSLSEKDFEDDLLELDKDDEEMLLAIDDDDDDEDEDEERSWKR